MIIDNNAVIQLIYSVMETLTLIVETHYFSLGRQPGRAGPLHIIKLLREDQTTGESGDREKKGRVRWRFCRSIFRQ